jgi:hypothetical protein
LASVSGLGRERRTRVGMREKRLKEPHEG